MLKTTIDDHVVKVVKQLHKEQSYRPNSHLYSTTVIVNGNHHEIRLSNQQLENNGPELHDLVRNMLLKMGERYA